MEKSVGWNESSEFHYEIRKKGRGKRWAFHRYNFAHPPFSFFSFLYLKIDHFSIIAFIYFTLFTFHFLLLTFLYPTNAFPDYSPIQTIQQRCLARMRQATLRQQTRTLTPEQQTKRTAREASLLRWGRTYLSTHFVKAPSQMHLWLANWLDREQQRGWKLNILAPRGGAKSTLVTLAYALRAALLNREPYIWIVSDTLRQASNHLENLRAEISDNSRLLRDYAPATGRGPRWRNTLLELNNGVVIEAIGTGQRVRGRRRREVRPTLIIADDLQSDRHMESPTNASYRAVGFMAC